jgi:Amt family ammonium transporter
VLQVIVPIGNFSKAMPNDQISFQGGNPVYALLQNVTTEPGSVPGYFFTMFQGKFAMITVILISGTLAERIKSSSLPASSSCYGPL